MYAHITNSAMTYCVSRVGLTGVWVLSLSARDENTSLPVPRGHTCGFDRGQGTRAQGVLEKVGGREGEERQIHE